MVHNYIPENLKEFYLDIIIFIFMAIGGVSMVISPQLNLPRYLTFPLGIIISAFSAYYLITKLRDHDKKIAYNEEIKQLKKENLELRNKLLKKRIGEINQTNSKT